MSSSSKSEEIEFPDAHPASVDLDGELQLAKLQRTFAGAKAMPVRYRQWEVEKLLGSGGMGRVYLARHVALDRRVAIKLMTPAQGGDEEARALRMIREAQALARVEHENVLAIHQVDSSGERTVIEMEYVEGSTLRTWQSAPGRGWRAIVEAYARAGDGLAAIHDAGLLHRDIKPDNLLVDSADRVKVADLGLAIAMRSEDADVDADADEFVQPEVLALPLTAGGGLVGTHGYMAPEVIAGDEASAASDQFSLAVSMYEAIFGALPFVGDSPRELARAMRNKSLAEPRVRGWRPRWLRRCLARALSFEPSLRYPSVAAFVAKLRWRVRLCRSVFGASATLMLGAGVAMAGWFAKPPPADPCAAASEELAAVWGPERRRAVLAGLADNEGANPALALLVSTLDERVASWRTARTQLCASERAHQHAPNSVQAQLDAQQAACLRYTKNHLEALVDALATGGGITSRYADLAEAVDGLPSCTQRLQLGHWAQVVRDDETDVRLSEALAAEVNGDYEHAIALARGVVGETKERDPFRHVQALYRLSRVLGLARQDSEALDVLEQARIAAFVLGHDELICRASAFEAKLSAGIRHEPAVARRELDFAEACAQRVGARSPLLRAELLEARGLLAQAADAPDQAVGWHRQALELRLEQLGPEHPAIAKSKLNLANALSAADPASVDEAQIRRLYVEAVELREASFGPNHPEVAHVLFDLGDFDRLRGELELARGSLERAERIYAKTDGGHPRARLKLHLAVAQMALSESRLPDARAELEHAASLEVGELDVRLERATLRFLEGMLALHEGDFRRAAAALRQARILHERLDPSGSASLSCMALELEASHGLRDLARVVALVHDGGPELRAHLETFGPEVCGAIAWYAAEALMDGGESDLARIYLELAQRSYAELGDADNSEQLEQLLTTLDPQQTTRP